MVLKLVEHRLQVCSQEGDEHFTAVADEDADGFFVLTAEGMSDMNGSTQGYCAVWIY